MIANVQRSQRLNQIMSTLVEQGIVDVSTLAEQFGVSTATIRRDLMLLENQKLASRTHGGATPHAAFNDVPLGYKTTQNLAEKRRIAECALQFLDGARVIGMTGGTTLTAFARLLLNREGLTVVTNALNIATDLVSGGNIRVFAAGGEVRTSSQECVGPTAEASLAGYNIHVTFLGVDGVDATAGCTNYDPAGAAVNAVLGQRGRMIVVLADATKISRVALAQVCTMSQVNVLITDDRADPAALPRKW